MIRNNNEFFSKPSSEEKEQRKMKLLNYQKQVNKDIDAVFKELESYMKSEFENSEEIEEFKKMMRPILQAEAEQTRRDKLKELVLTNRIKKQP